MLIFLSSYAKMQFDSANYDQREKEKTRIEKAFRESDKRLGELVTGKCWLLVFNLKYLYEPDKKVWKIYHLHLCLTSQ